MAENEMEMKNQLKVDVDDHDDVDQKIRVWPDWLPSDWYICRDIDRPHSSSQHHSVYYSNPKGKKFYSREEVLHYISTRPIKKVSNQVRKRRITMLKETHNKSEENKKIEEEHNASQEGLCSQISTVWPDWLPDDWHIDRSYDDPTNVTYCSPKWKKFRSKDEVLRYIDAQSKKMSKQTRKRITRIKDTTKKLVQSRSRTKTCEVQS